MNYFGWKQVKKEIDLKSILEETYVDFSPKSINLDFDIESIYKDSRKFSNMEISIKYIDDRIAKKGYHGALFVEGGENLIVLCFLYMSLHHMGTDYSFVEDVQIGSDGYVYSKSLPQEQKEKYENWASKLENKIEALIDSGIVDNINELCENFANMKIIATVCEIVYVGPTKAIKYSGNMSIGQFADMVKEQFNIIPVFLRKGEYKEYPPSTMLGEIGVSGEKTLDVKIKMDVSSLGKDIQEQNNLNAYIAFKYVKRPWAFIEESTFDNANILPGFFKSLGWTLLFKYAYKYVDRV